MNKHYTGFTHRYLTNHNITFDCCVKESLKEKIKHFY